MSTSKSSQAKSSQSKANGGGKDIRAFFSSQGTPKPTPTSSKPTASQVIDLISDDEKMAVDPGPSKKRKSTVLLSSDDEDEGESPPKKKPVAVAKPKPRPSITQPTKPTRKHTVVESSGEEDDSPPKKVAKSTKPKPRRSTTKDDDFVVDDDEEDEKPKKGTPKPKAGSSKQPKDESKPKFNWAAARAAKLAGPSAPGSKAIPDGAPDALAGLAFVFTGELSSFSRDEIAEAAKRYGGRVVGQPSGKTDFVVLGENAGPSKLNAIKKHGLKTLSEDQFLDLIRTRPGSGKLDEKAAKKLEKEQEAIKSAAKEMEKREKQQQASAIEPAGQLWTTRYAPQSLKEICGNKGQVEKLQQWLKDWSTSLKAGFKKPGKNGMNVYRAVLITGPPGIGKTTSAHLVAKLEGFTPIELNASDARSKKLVENGMNVNNKSLDGYIAGARETDGVAITDRTCLIMDEVDGMSAGDRGGVGALNAMIKKSKVPIICIANDRGAQKLKPLLNNVFSIAFQRPAANMIRSRLMTIAFKEKMSIPANVLDQLVAGAQSDIRQVLNMMSTWRLSSQTMSFDDGKMLAKMNEKYTIMSPFDITTKILGPYMFSSTARETLGDKMELYFQDHSFVPLFIQENYLKTEAARLRNYDGPMKQLKSLELMEKAAASISDGDLVDAMIHGSEQHWGLMPLHAVCSTVRPASFVYGQGAHYGGANSLSFPQWLGQNSKQQKLNRNLTEVGVRMRLKISGDKAEIRQSYLPALFPHIIAPLMESGTTAVDPVISKMDEYYLSKEDWDAIIELGVDERKDEVVLKKISAATKTALTKKYNASEHPIPFYKAVDLGKAPKKLAASGPAPDIEDAFEVDEEIVDSEDEKEKVKDPDDVSKDKLIKAPKKKAGGGTEKAGKGKKK
ncbi:Replication factor C subunit 1 [Mycena indigotica]|uniref:Replication factor C subunit 1 n=1 Tax=Mycena indigotica TaxID=2126181 RepID=A0A8H6SMU9_9AGAR|nr:Replication factor C subunit 1 [Mycena indigotica]KAF7301137.1 Replication factor C subunit 1 [Mycena indigotica]